MLRNIFIFCLAAYGLRHAARGPFFALLFYLWIAYFRPESWVWDTAVESLNLSLIGGGILVLSALARGQFYHPGLRSFALGALLAQGLISTLVSAHYDYCWGYWTEFAKTVLVSYLIGCLVTDVQKFRLTLVLIAASLGFEVAKQGWLQLLTNPGAKNFNPHPFLGDENGVAMGVLMLVPILTALAQTSSSTWQRRGWAMVNIGAFYRAISTYSRGAFLSSGVLGLLVFLRSKNKMRTALAMVVVCATVFPVLPDAFWERMGTIAFSEDKLRKDDDSSRGRLHFWRVAVRMANDRPLIGVGLNGFNPSYNKYDFLDGRYGVRRAAHSSWFAMLAELGYPGLALFALNLGLALWACRTVRKAAASGSAPEELAHYAVALESSLVVFIVGGTFLSSHYVEMLWHIVGLSAALLAISRVPVTANQAVSSSADAASSPLGPARPFSVEPLFRPPAPPVPHVPRPSAGAAAFRPRALDAILERD